MRHTALIAAAAAGWLAGASLPGQTPAGGGRAGGNALPGRGAASVRLEAWSAMRSAAAAVLGWRVGIAADRFRDLTFSEAAGRADLLGLGVIAGSGRQKLNPEIPKYVDYRLAPGEILAVNERLNALALAMPAYAVPTIGPDEESSRQLFEFARRLRVEVLVSEEPPAALPLVDQLAQEFNISVAVCGSLKSVLAALEGRGPRLGACGDTAAWMQEGVRPLEAVQKLGSRLLVLHLRDRSDLGRSGRDVPVGAGAAGLPELLQEMYRLEMKPALLLVGGSGGPDALADLTRSLEGFEKALHPVMAARVSSLSKTAAIRGPERLTAEMRRQIDAALPSEAPAKPRKPRRLLVLDLNIAYGGHASIPAANYGLEQMGKRTGAYEAVFQNDLDNLKYDKIRQFDAVYLNNTVGMIFVDPAVRDGLTRFVREGGGLGGNHGVSHASMDWPGFSEMIGVRRGIHREATEQAWIKIDDPHSPLTVPFEGKPFLHQDEFFRFPNPPYSRGKLHVLLSMDVEKTDMNQGRACPWPCSRPDHDYAVSWIKSYGQGRVFFAIIGHNPTIYTTPPLAQYFLRGIQFILGDLEADTTPGARSAGPGRGSPAR